MKNIFVIVCAVFLLFGDLSADAGLRIFQRNRCQPQSCCPAPKTCCPAPKKCCPAPKQCCCKAPTCRPAPACCPVTSCCGNDSGSVVLASASSPAPVAAAAVFQADSNVVYGGNNFVAAPATSDCGCGGAVMDTGVISYSDDASITPAVAPPADGGTIESPASEVPAAPVGDSSSYIGAPALQPGEWVVEGSEKVVESGDAAAGGVEVQAVSATSEVVTGDAVPTAPAEDTTEAKADAAE